MKKMISALLSVAVLTTTIFGIQPIVVRAETLPQEKQKEYKLLTQEELLPYIDYENAVEHGHVERIYDEEDLNTIVYRNMDGTKTAYIFDYDVKYVKDDGTVEDKDIDLVEIDGGYGVKRSDISLTIPDDIMHGVEFEHEDSYIKITPIRETLFEEALSKSAAVQNIPQVAVADEDENEIYYEKAFGNGTGLRYRPTLMGIKEEIVLENYSGTNSWKFILQTNGLKPYVDDSGVYYFANSQNQYSLGNVYTYDSVGNYTYGTMSIQEITEGELYTVTLGVDETFLTDENIVYPVYVDPTLTAKSQYFNDAFVYNGSNYKNKNYMSFSTGIPNNYIGFSTAYGVGRYVVSAYNTLSNNPILYTYMNRLIDATFNVYFSPVHSFTQKISLYEYTNVWEQNTITWDNGASNYANMPVDTKTIQPGGYVSFDISYFITRWRYNDNSLKMGMLIKRDDESNVTCEYLWDSQRSANRSYIAIQYETDLSEHYRTNVEIYEGETIDLEKSGIYETAEVVCVSQDSSIVTVINKSLITGITTGTTNVQITVDPNGYSQTLICEVCVKTCPSKFKQLINDGVMKYTEIESIENDENFYMFNRPISAIIQRYGVAPFGKVLTHYVFCIVDAGVETYGLVRFDTSNEVTSGVSLSFREFDMSKLIGCKTVELTESLNAVIDKIMSNTPIDDYDINLVHYFQDWDSLGGYIIADLYISKVITDVFKNSKLIVNTSANDYVKNYTCGNYKNSDLANAVDKYNELAGRKIYDLDTGVISLSNTNEPTMYEKLMILISHTGNTSYQSFVAEIKSHADWVLGLDEDILSEHLYSDSIGILIDVFVNITMDDYVNSHTIVADMSIQSYEYKNKSKSNTIIQFLISTKMYGIKNNSPEKYQYMLN